jgi:hypothetical protein
MLDNLDAPKSIVLSGGYRTKRPNKNLNRSRKQEANVKLPAFGYDIEE